MTRGPADLAPERRAFAARHASIDAAAAFVREHCARHRIDRTRELKLTLLVEELLTNTIDHGYGVESDALVHVTLQAEAGRVVLLYEDDGPPFDPVARGARAAAALDEPIDRRAEGGMGTRLIDGIASSARYRREHGTNRTWLTLDLPAHSSAG